jgi:signal transduction histidine kinase
MHRSQKLESLGVLVAGVAHDFKNLLGAITNCADLTLWSLDDAASARRAIWQIKVAVGQMADLSDQLFDYAGCSSLMAEPLDLCALVRETQPLLESLLPKSTKVAYELDGELLGIEGDPSQIRQVLVNLITNASESLMGEPGCVTVRTGTRRVGRDLLAEAYRGIDLEEGEFVYLEVQDTGCGMDAETQSGVFDPFFSTKQDGRGLGMAAVGDILRRHGGAIRIESSPGEGATFSVLFKALPDRARALPERTPPDERGERPPETPILVVDDE